jgi:hypothetical protein
MESGYPIRRFSELLEELSVADAEHPNVSVTHESDWCLSIFRSGFVVLENLEDGEPMHHRPADSKQTIEIMVEVATGRIDEARSRPWHPGYPPRRAS